jgi:hypothetical protein
VACGTDLDFSETVTDSVNVYTVDFTLNASHPGLRVNEFFDDVESGAGGWTKGGVNNFWNITTSQYHSSNHSWADSPSGNYANNTNSWLRSANIDLSGLSAIQVSAWVKYTLETGYDNVYLDYSADGGATWSEIDSFSGTSNWVQISYDVPALDDQANASIRFRLVSDGSTVADGIYIDDVAISYKQHACDGPTVPSAPMLVAPPDGTSTLDPLVAFEWQDSGQGGLPVGYVLNLDSVPTITVTYPVTSTTLTLTIGAHTWYVAAYNDQG